MFRSGCTAVNGSLKEKETHELYSVNIHKNLWACAQSKRLIQYSLRLNIYIWSSKYRVFSKEDSPYTPAIWQNIRSKDVCTTSEACIFLAFPIFTVFCTVPVCVRARDKAELTSNGLVPSNNTSQSCRLYLWSSLDGACSVAPSQ